MSGPWCRDEINGYRDNSVIPIRLAVQGDTGYPIIASLWFLRQGSTIVCSSQRAARILQCLRKKPVCAFEISGDDLPYHGVRGQGDVDLSYGDGQGDLGKLVSRYLADTNLELQEWLLSRSDSEISIRIEPRNFCSWDYRKRMAQGSP